MIDPSGQDGYCDQTGCHVTVTLGGGCGDQDDDAAHVTVCADPQNGDGDPDWAWTWGGTGDCWNGWCLGSPDDQTTSAQSTATSATGPAPTGRAQPPQTTRYQNSCVTGALGKGALSLGIDSIGLIPEAGGLARVIGHQAGYVGVVADQLGFRVVNAVGKSTSTASGLAGLSDTSPEGLLSTGLTVAGFIPGLGQAASIGSIIVDIYKTGKAIGQCH